MKSLLVLYSYHHHNTEKIATVMAKALGAEVREPKQVDPAELHKYDLVGFGSGIYGAKHHRTVLDLVDRMPRVYRGRAIIFSTDGAPRGFIKDPGMAAEQMKKNHAVLREKLESRGYVIVGEFNCGGFNTNSFLKLFGGINKGRPDSEDLEKAEMFAQDLVNKIQEL